jgi:hypothetical protein
MMARLILLTANSSVSDGAPSPEDYCPTFMSRRHADPNVAGKRVLPPHGEQNAATVKVALIFVQISTA